MGKKMKGAKVLKQVHSSALEALSRAAERLA